MEDCLFCKINKGEIPANTIYENKIVKVFLDINPVTNGHMLIIPKKHYESLLDVDSEIITYSMNLIKEKLYPMLKEKLNCEGLTIVQNNDLGQEVKHYHIHIIPRYKNDNAAHVSNKELLVPVDEVYETLTK